MGGFALLALLFAFLLAFLIYRESQSRLRGLLYLEARHQLEVQEASGRQKAEFLSNMSHELRTPLNSIIGFSEVLIDGTFGPLLEKQKSYVNHVLSSGKHLLLLIDQILDMSKVESGKMRLSKSKVYLGALLKEMAGLMSQQALKKGLELGLELPAYLPEIEGDQRRLKEVLFNLLSNAINFTPAGGKIGLRAREVAIGVEIEVWDNGNGIAPQDLERVFEGFFRIETPPSRLVEGTGLGLSIARKLVELHGGKLELSSVGLGQGVLVRVTLPLKFKGV
jgi:two-component system CheB/CheR fusion protein